MSEKIYILVDTDGDAICAFTEKEKALKEAMEVGCDVEEIPLYS